MELRAMFIMSTAYVIQSKDGKVVILAYRGTEPGNFVNWLTDVDLYPDKVQFRFVKKGAPYDVHAGFYRNFRATRFEMGEVLKRAMNGKTVTDPVEEVSKMEKLYITGHSLGAARAALMGITIHTESRLIPSWSGIPFTYQFNDHGPQHYIAALTPEGSATEFGDRNYVSDKPGRWSAPSQR